MRRQLRETVRARYGLRCGYCGVSETDVGAKMTVDHYFPRSLGGDETLDNLVYSCHACNEFKGEFWSPDPDRCLLHPLLDDLAAHFHEQTDHTLQAFTERGSNHLQVLQLNRDALVAHRRERGDIARIRARCRLLEEYIAGLEGTEGANNAEIGALFGVT